MHRHTPDGLKIEVGSVATKQELQELLAEALHFPDYYGQNWNAFDECIRDVELPSHIEITVMESLHARLPTEAQSLQQCVADFVKESGHDITMRRA
jgi:RNAse (barnase) inhibitor barstar